MSNTRATQPPASQNHHKGPTSLQCLQSMAQGIGNLQMMLSQRPAAVHLQCGLCIGLMKKWEADRQPEIEKLAAEHAEMIGAFQAFMQSDAPDEEKQQAAIQGVPDLASFVKHKYAGTDSPMPGVFEGITIITVPGAGATLVCAVHVPQASEVDQGRRPLLIANAPLSSSLIASMRQQ